jgi:hypothetical protein
MRAPSGATPQISRAVFASAEFAWLGILLILPSYDLVSCRKLKINLGYSL